MHGIRKAVAVAAVVVATITSLLALAPGTAGAAGPWYVATTGSDAASCLSPGTPCRTIQAAINKATPGDTVNVADGQYVERLVVGKAITVAATNPGQVEVFANGSLSSLGNALVVNVLAAAPNNVVRLQGVDITGGYASFGGGIAHFAGDLRLEDVDLHSNVAAFGGGAWVGAGATLRTTGGSIRANIASSGGGLYGYGTNATALSGISYAGPGAVLEITGTTIAHNTANGGSAANAGNGGAIVNAGALTVTNATFFANRAIASTAGSVRGFGGSIFTGPLDAGDAPTASITDTRIDGGSSTVGANAVHGGGIAATSNLLNAAGAQPSTLSITGSTIEQHLLSTGGAGAGLHLLTSATISSSTISQNATAANGAGGGLYALRSPATAPIPTVALSDVEVSGNRASLGGGITVGPLVTLAATGGTVVDENQATSGAGVWTQGTTSFTDSVISGNDAAFQGGGIFAAATTGTPSVTLTRTTLSGNTAANAGGGAIAFASHTLTATDSTVTENAAVLGAGIAVWEGASGTFTGTDFLANVDTFGYGGAGLYNAGSATVDDAVFADNTTPGSGAAIFNGRTTNGTTASLAVDRSTFTDNIATVYGGAIYSGTNLVFAQAGTSATGTTSRVSVDRSTFSGNRAATGSVILSWTTVAGTNVTSFDRSTLHANPAGTNGAAVATFHPVTIAASTLTDNTPFNVAQGVANVVSVTGSILSGATAGECNAPVVDGGHNLTDSGDVSCGFSAAENDVFGAPMLGALADNGGPTETRLPGPSSPAINQIPVGTATGINRATDGSPVVLCAAGVADQRGTGRPQGASCDIGAVEAALSAPVLTGPTEGDYAVGVGAAPVVFSASGVPTPVLSLSDGTLPAGLTFTPNADGTGTLSGTPTSGPGGEYEIEITATNSEGTDTHSFTIVLREAPALTGPTVATFEAGVLGTTDDFEQTAGFPVAAFSVVGSLPGDIAIVDDGDGTARLTGTAPVGSGGAYAVTVVADNGTEPAATLDVVLTVTEAPTLTGPPTATFRVGVDGSSGGFTATGFPVAGLTATGLPDGVTLVDNGNGTAQLEGTPEPGTGGEHVVVVTAANGIAPDATHEVLLTVEDAPTLAGSPVVGLVVGLDGETGYVSTGFPVADLTATGALPSGVTFTDNGDGTATLGGTPGAGTEGTYPITVRASNGVAPDAELAVTITVAPHVVITTTELPDASVGTTYSAPVLAEGGLPSYTFSIVGGSLPAGLSLASDGTVSGMPTGPAGVSTFTVQVTDSTTGEPQVDTQDLSITVDRGVTHLDAAPVLLHVKRLLGIKITIGTVSATLRGGDPAVPLAGQVIQFKIGGNVVCTGVTGADGTATCSMSVANTLAAILNSGVVATYDGTPSWEPTARRAPVIGLP